MEMEKRCSIRFNPPTLGGIKAEIVCLLVHFLWVLFTSAYAISSWLNISKIPSNSHFELPTTFTYHNEGYPLSKDYTKRAEHIFWFIFICLSSSENTQSMVAVHVVKQMDLYCKQWFIGVITTTDLELTASPSAGFVAPIMVAQLGLIIYIFRRLVLRQSPLHRTTKCKIFCYSGWFSHYFLQDKSMFSINVRHICSE